LTNEALDNLARQALLDAIHQEYGGLMAEMPEHDFLPGFEKKMRRLIRRANHPVRHRIVQAVACLVLAILLSGCAVLAVSPEARTALAGWIKELRQEWSSYHYAGEIADTPRNTVYYPAWIPADYQEVKSPEPGTFVHALYEGKDGSLLSFSYQSGLKRTTFHVVWDNTTIQQVAVAGSQADLYLNTAGDTNILVWTDEAQGVVFWLAGQLAGEELVQVAESLQESEPLDWVYRPTWLPGAIAWFSSTEENGEGHTVYESGEEKLITFCYSKTGITPYAERPDGQTVTMQNGTAMLYHLEESGDLALTWVDGETGYAFWLVSEIPIEDMVRIAESVEIYQNNINDVLEIDTDNLLEGPLCEQVKLALTDEFVEKVKEYARRDAEANIYMQSDYIDFETAYTKAHISPERDSAVARVSAFIKDHSFTDGTVDNHVLCLVEPLYFVDVTVSYHQKTANIYDENGIMIAGYTSMDDHWTAVSTFEEKQFGYVVAQIYAAAFQEERTKLINSE
jgi:hypothetical protein